MSYDVTHGYKIVMACVHVTGHASDLHVFLCGSHKLHLYGITTCIMSVYDIMPPNNQAETLSVLIMFTWMSTGSNISLLVTQW